MDKEDYKQRIKEEYKQYIKELVDTIQPIINHKDEFIEHCREHKERISTGFPGLDKAFSGGLTNELYIMAAETSTGKSAFLMTLAQNAAEAGIDVLYFSLEMGKDEFIARGISRISYEHYKESKNGPLMTAGDILNWKYDTTLNEFVRVPYSQYEKYSEEYFERYGSRLHIIEGGINGITARDIANMVSLFKKDSNEPVVVFVDYLQLIRAESDDRSQADRKTKTDVSVTTLKCLASQIGLPVITISSISRSSYNGKISSSAFKESGDTEYTGGVLLGWNWVGVTDGKDETEKEQEKECCRKRGYRKMSLNVLKNRNSVRDVSIGLKYYPAYSYFEEDDGWDPVKEKDTPFANEEDIIECRKKRK